MAFGTVLRRHHLGCLQKETPYPLGSAAYSPAQPLVTATLRPNAMETSILDVSHKWTFIDLDVSEVPPRCSSHWYLITF